ncbi:hypothetical protein D3C81_2265170 [compost metagenome]
MIYRGSDLTFVWVHKLLSAFSSHAVFSAGLLVASGLTLGAWRLLREVAKLPAERTQAPHSTKEPNA